MSSEFSWLLQSKTLGDSQRALYGEAEKVVDTGTAGLIEEEAPPGYWPG